MNSQIQMQDLYLFVSSSDSCKNFYPRNTQSRFTIQLPDTLHLNHTPWYCALRDISCEITKSVDLYVFCDVIEDSYVREQKLPILQHIPFTTQARATTSKGEEGIRVVTTFDSSIAHRIKITQLKTLTIYITDKDLKPPSFTSAHVTCTLHLFTK